TVSSISVPKEKTGLVIGRGASNLKRIREATGASVFLEDGVALIKGTESERAKAKALIQEILSKEPDKVVPDVGYNLLEFDEELMDIKRSKIRFRKYDGEDANLHSRNHTLYTAEIVVEKKGKSSDEDDDLSSAISKLLLSSGLPSKSKDSNGLPSNAQGFNTTKIIRHCLGDICTLVHRSEPSQIETQTVRLNIFFGPALRSSTMLHEFVKRFS
ncbi:6638_t:CDS:2, partial [Ambispora leptoticha]